MSNTFKLLFHLRKPKCYTKGPQPIYLRITVNGERSEITTQRECDPDFCISESGRMQGNREQVKLLNAYLDGMVNKVYACQNDVIQNKFPISAEAIKNKFIGKLDKARMLVQIFENHNNQIAALVGKEYVPGTFARYKTSLSHKIEFLQWKYSVSDIYIRSINHESIANYDFYLRSVRKCSNNSIVSGNAGGMC